MNWFKFLAKLYPGRSARNVQNELVATDPTPGYHTRPYGPINAAGVEDLPFFHLQTATVMLRDPTVSFGLAMRNAMLSAGEIEIKSKSSAVTEYVGRLWKAIWEKHHDKLCETKQHGFGAFQMVFDERRGMAEVVDVKDFSPHDVRARTFEGRLCGFSVRSSSLQGETQLRTPRALWTTYKARGGNFYGFPMLRKAYSPWYEKHMPQHGARKVIRQRMIKDAFTGDVFWYPPDRVVTLPDGSKVSFRDIMREMQENKLSGGGYTMPSIYDREGHKLVDYLQAKDTGNPEGIWRWNDELDGDIWLGLEVPGEIIEAASPGSGFSGRSIPFIVALQLAAVEFAELVGCIDLQVIRPLVGLHFGAGAEYELVPKDLVETYCAKLGGSQMGGSAIGGGNQQQQQHPPQFQQRPQPHEQATTQFSEPAVQFEEPWKTNPTDALAGAALEASRKAMARTLRAFNRNLPAMLERKALDDLMAKLDGLLVELTPEITDILADVNLSAALAGQASIAQTYEASGLVQRGGGQRPPTLPPIGTADAFSGDSFFVRLPVVEDAVETLRTSPVFAGSDFRETAAAVRDGSFAITADLRAETLGEIRNALSAELEEGLSQERFIEKSQEILGRGLLSESRLAMVFRNNVGSALSDAQERALGRPLVADAFPYRAIDATHDNRTRAAHRALETAGLNGTNIYRSDDPVFVTFRGPWDYGCRCDSRPVTVRQAAEAGVKEAQEWLNRAEQLVAERGGQVAQYMADSAPLQPARVSWPMYNGQAIQPNPDFSRAPVQFDEGQPEKPEEHEFSSAQFNMTGDLAFRVRQLGERIPHEDLIENGREDNPHITVKFGLHTNDPEEVRTIVRGESPVAIQFGKCSIFAAKYYDVVKIEVVSKSLHELNKRISESLECTDTHPEYKPHVTIAYVKQGLGDKYAKTLNNLEGEVAVFGQLVFSDKTRKHHSIPLTGAAQFSEPVAKKKRPRKKPKK